MRTLAVRGMLRNFCCLALLALGSDPPSASAESPACLPGSLYLKRENLQVTLLAARQHYRAWLLEQPRARGAVTFSPWLATPLLARAESEGLVAQRRFDPLAKQPGGGPLWTAKPELKDGSVGKIVTGTPDKVVLLARTIQAKQPVRLTIGTGGGDRMDVWLNGRQVATADTHLVSGRYGCAYRVDGTQVDQWLVDLDLSSGENSLIVRIIPGDEPGFYFSASPRPVVRLWEQVRRDFNAEVNPLLRDVPAEWFEPAGWMAAVDCLREQKLIAELSSRCGKAGAELLAAMSRLRDAKVLADDRRWLDLCVKSSTLALMRRDIERLRDAVGALDRSYHGVYPTAAQLARLRKFETRLDALAAGALDPAEPGARALLDELPVMRRTMLVDLNPQLRDAELAFVKRYTYDSKHYYDDFQHIRRWGGNIYAYRLRDGRLRPMVPQLEGGIFDRYDLSFDGRRVAFGYRTSKPEGFRIFESGVDGTGLRQLTRAPADESDRIAKYGRTSTGDSFYASMGYQFWTDDVHPCYLPDGGFCFASTRCEHGVLCTPLHYLACTNLFRMRGDGSGIEPISRGMLSEFTPTMLEDGRILYNRWEYVYKGIAAVQPLWITRPDGSGSQEFYGDNIANPGVFWQARQVPGHANLAVCIGCGHEPLGVGQVLLLDLTKNKRTPEPMTNLTPEVKVQNLRGLYQLRNGVWREDVYGPFFADPYPLSDKFFLVACNPDRRYNDMAGYGIWLIDTFGNRVPIYADSEISCWQPMLLAPRPTPPVLPPSQVEAPNDASVATVFLSDVYRGLPGVKPGTIKYLRVMEQIAKPWAAEVDSCRGEDRGADGHGGHLAVSLNAHIWVAVLRGIVPVRDDGSACFEVPANRNLYFQALDADYMEVQRMRTFVNFAPGERRSCIGCHEHRTEAPAARTMPARANAEKLAAQPGEVAPRPLYYPSDVQPAFDRLCVRCHAGQAKQAAPDLRPEMTTLFNRSYESLLQAGLVNTIREWNGGNYAMQHAEAVPPYTYGSHRSRLVEVLKAGHYDCTLTREEWVKLVTWIDCGAPYYGSYFGRRHLKYQGQPDFRPIPTIDSACGTPPPSISAIDGHSGKGIAP